MSDVVDISKIADDPTSRWHLVMPAEVLWEHIGLGHTQFVVRPNLWRILAPELTRYGFQFIEGGALKHGAVELRMLVPTQVST